MAATDPRLVAQKANELWHTDSSYRFVPSYCSLLYAIVALPDEAQDGETEFSNMFLAYDALPAALPSACPSGAGNFLLEPELLLLELPYAKRVRRRVGRLAPDGLIQVAVTVSQFADTSFDGHGLRLHV